MTAQTHPQDEAQGAPAERAARHLTEASTAAHEQIAVLSESLAVAIEHAIQITDGGEAYPAPIRYLCRLISEEASIRRRALIALAAKAQADARR